MASLAASAVGVLLPIVASPFANGAVAEGKLLTAPGEGFWARFATEAQAVRHLKTIPKIKGIMGSFRLLWRSDALLEQNMRDLLTIRTFLSELCQKTDVDPATKRLMALQALSFIVAYREPDVFEGHFHSFTFDFPDAKGNPVTYRLDEIIDLGGEIKAFGFVSDTKDEPPLLLYHGTFSYTGAPACLPTIKADFERKGVGFATFKKNEENIKKWLEAKSKGGTNKAIVSGHSLGAAFGLYTTVFCSEYVQEATVFSAPGVNNETYEKWLPMKNEADRAQIKVYNAKSDIVSKWGGDYTVGDVYEGFHTAVSSSMKNEMTLHKVPLFLQQAGFVYQRQQPNTVKTKDMRFPLLGGAGAVMLLPVVVGFVFLIKFVIVPAITAMVIAGTWPVLLAALGAALVTIALVCLIYAAQKKTFELIVKNMADEFQSSYKMQYKNIQDLRADFASGKISTEQFAYYYRTQFYSLEKEHIPFKVALLREMAFAYRTVHGDTALRDLCTPMIEEMPYYLFHPEKYIDRMCSDAPYGIYETKLRRAWKSINSPTFFGALERVEQRISQKVEELQKYNTQYETIEDLRADFASEKISTEQFAIYYRMQFNHQENGSLLRQLFNAHCERKGKPIPRSDSEYLRLLFQPSLASDIQDDFDIINDPVFVLTIERDRARYSPRTEAAL